MDITMVCCYRSQIYALMPTGTEEEPPVYSRTSLIYMGLIINIMDAIFNICTLAFLFEDKNHEDKTAGNW